MAAGGERNAVKKGHYARAALARARFDRAADRLFFPSLWRRVAVVSKDDDAVFEAKYAFLSDLKESGAGRVERRAAPKFPVPRFSGRRPRRGRVGHSWEHCERPTPAATCSARRKRMPPHDETPARAVLAAAAMMQHLDPGSLAELRRMEQGKGAPVFWRLVTRHPQTIGQPEKEEVWTNIIRIVAILTPRGDQNRRPPLHNRTTPAWCSAV